jgi:hypothetical protein
MITGGSDTFLTAEKEKDTIVILMQQKGRALL